MIVCLASAFASLIRPGNSARLLFSNAAESAAIAKTATRIAENKGASLRDIFLEQLLDLLLAEIDEWERSACRPWQRRVEVKAETLVNGGYDLRRLDGILRGIRADCVTLTDRAA